MTMLRLPSCAHITAATHSCYDDDVIAYQKHTPTQVHRTSSHAHLTMYSVAQALTLQTAYRAATFYLQAQADCHANCPDSRPH